MQTYYFWYFGYAWSRPSRYSTNLLGTGFCLHVKNNLDPSLFSWDLTLQRMLQSVWPRAIGPLTWEAEFYQIKGLQRNINIFHLWLSPGKTNDKIFLKYGKKKIFVLVLPILGKKLIPSITVLKTDRRTDGQGWIYRTLLIKAKDPKSSLRLQLVVQLLSLLFQTSIINCELP